MRLSILSVLGETFGLWFRHLGFFILLAFFLAFPELVFGRRLGHEFTFWNAMRGAAGFAVHIIFQAVGMAATLGLLQASFAKPRWLVAAQSVRRHSGQLLGVQVLITLIAMLLMVPFGLAFFLVKFFGGFGLIFFMMGELVFLILLKYALASPLVVVENLTATSALVVSWTMTRHRFGFVLGCYLLAGVVDGSIRAVTTLISAPTYLSGVISLPLLVISTYWYVLPWVMYLCIREAEQEPLPASVY